MDCHRPPLNERETYRTSCYTHVRSISIDEVEVRLSERVYNRHTHGESKYKYKIFIKVQNRKQYREINIIL